MPLDPKTTATASLKEWKKASSKDLQQNWTDNELSMHQI